ncbi:MAG: YadA-like family protein, partial [Neisseriaceae bacterium]|nr:YadA-like family protein [Neisseriaceae bacterium]
VEKRANAGTAAAMAAGNLQIAAKPGGNSFSISGATFAGEAGYAMGYSTMSSDGKWGFNAFGNGDSRGRFGGGASVGFHW